jgi:hypothetical protein
MWVVTHDIFGSLGALCTYTKLPSFHVQALGARICGFDRQTKAKHSLPPASPRRSAGERPGRATPTRRPAPRRARWEERSAGRVSENRERRVPFFFLSERDGYLIWRGGRRGMVHWYCAWTRPSARVNERMALGDESSDRRASTRGKHGVGLIGKRRGTTSLKQCCWVG